MCFLRHAEHHARNRTSLAGLEQDLLFFGPPHIKSQSSAPVAWVEILEKEVEASDT